jgi:hypothetical protein
MITERFPPSSRARSTRARPGPASAIAQSQGGIKDRRPREKLTDLTENNDQSSSREHAYGEIYIFMYEV